jgi:hypothetical protein
MDEMIAASSEPTSVEITLFTIIFQGIGYIFMMGVANLCYLLGAKIEKYLKLKNPEDYRKLTYNLGFWGSFALPFSIPTLIVIIYG